MPIVRFTSNLARHRPVPELAGEGATVAEVLADALGADPFLKSYILDEQGRARKHVNIFVDGTMISDRIRLSDPVHETTEIYILQALSGG